jgi:nucleotide-binding universal stress UspA family protein
VQFVQPPDRQEVAAELKRMAAEAGATGHVTVAAIEGDAGSAIVDEALTRKAALIVMATHGRSGVQRLLLGSVAEAVLETAACPVMTVPPHAVADREGDVRITRVLCAVDYSPASYQALGFALAIARERHAALTVLHVVESLPDDDVSAGTSVTVPEFPKALLADAHEKLRGVISEAAPGRAGIVDRVVSGRAGDEILAVAADMGADLLVMGARSPGALGTAFFGSTTSHVVRQAACPVLTMRAAPIIGG